MHKIAVLLWLFAIADSADLYVDPLMGSDIDGDGGFSLPFRTIKRAVGIIDGFTATVHLNSGNHFLGDETIVVQYPISFVSSTPRKAILSISPNVTQSSTIYLRISSTANISFSGVVFTGDQIATKTVFMASSSGGLINFNDCAFQNFRWESWINSTSEITFNSCVFQNISAPKGTVFLNPSLVLNNFEINGCPTIPQSGTFKSQRGIKMINGNIYNIGDVSSNPSSLIIPGLNFEMSNVTVSNSSLATLIRTFQANTSKISKCRFSGNFGSFVCLNYNTWTMIDTTIESTNLSQIMQIDSRDLSVINTTITKVNQQISFTGINLSFDRLKLYNNNQNISNYVVYMGPKLVRTAETLSVNITNSEIRDNLFPDSVFSIQNASTISVASSSFVNNIRRSSDEGGSVFTIDNSNIVFDRSIFVNNTEPYYIGDIITNLTYVTTSPLTSSALTTSAITTSPITTAALTTLAPPAGFVILTALPNKIDVVAGNVSLPPGETIGSALDPASKPCGMETTFEDCQGPFVTMKPDEFGNFESDLYLPIQNIDTVNEWKVSVRVGLNYSGSSTSIWKFGLVPVDSSSPVYVLFTSTGIMSTAWTDLLLTSNKPFKEYNFGDSSNGTVKIRIFTLAERKRDGPPMVDNIYTDTVSIDYQSQVSEIKQEPVTKKKDNKGVIIGAIVGAVGIAVIATVILFLIMRRRRLARHRDLSDWTGLPDGDMRAITDVTVGKRIGGGNFGDVFVGTAYGGTTKVALKLIKSEAMHEFVAESEVSNELQNPYCCLFLGIYTDEQNKCYIVTEFCERGSLLDFLIKREGDLTYLQILDYAHQAAMGMAYLEENNIVHRDLACRNLLMSGERVKVADFGMSKNIGGETFEDTSGGKVPTKWCSPEVLQSRTYSSKSDSWSMGVTLYEIITYGSGPYNGLDNSQTADWVVRQRKILPKPTGCPDKYWRLIEDCMLYDPADRPTLAQISNRLGELEEDERKYPTKYFSVKPVFAKNLQTQYDSLKAIV